MAKHGEYIHGTDPEEQQRLSLLNDLLNERSLSALSVQGGERILDVGSGLGQLSRGMARAAGSAGWVVGVERDPDQLGEAQRLAEDEGEVDLVDFRQGDASDLPLDDDEWGTFDLAHTRFLLEHVPSPQSIVDDMVRALRPGGRIILEDDDHDVLRLWPEPEGVYEVWQAYIEVYRRLGNDPNIGRKLSGMLHTAGADLTRCDWLFFGACAGEASFAAFVENFAGVVESAREQIESQTNVSGQQVDDAMSAFRQWGLQEASTLWYATFWAEGRRPGG